LLLDNKPSNHTSEVKAALGDVTIPIRATTWRPQNRAHVEGGLGPVRKGRQSVLVCAGGPAGEAAYG
jgi:hypothetical protein